MSNPQGLRPFDPYRTLQLHPAAPRELVEKAYWLLVSSVRSSDVSGLVVSESRVSGPRIQELNAAYAMLLDDGARRSYDEAHGFRGLADRAARQRGSLLRLFPAKKPGAGFDDCYHALRVDREADSRIIELAYDFWTHALQGGREERGRIEEAHRTLSNPQLRAQYDARQIGKITKQVHEQIQNARHNENTTYPEVPAHLANAPRTTLSGKTAPQGQVASAAPPDVGPIGPLASVYTLPAKETSAIAPPFAAEPEARPAVGADAGPAPLPDTRAHPLAPATKLPAGRQLAEAQQNRLLQLREDPVASDGPAPAGMTPEPRAAATLAFVAGPRGGERVELAAEIVTLGSDSGCAIVLEDATANIAPEHARLKRHGATYMFSDVAGHDTMIADRPPTLPVVMLEDGDEIQIGVHRMRFATERAIS